MANFSVNQVRHLYVAKDYVDGSTKTALTNNGDIEVKKADNDLYFLYKNGKGEVTHSDFINLKNLDRVEAIKSSAMATKMRKISLTLADNPVSGQDYVLGINFKNFFSSGDASQYYKDAVVHASSSVNTKSLFYKAMVKALNLAFSREDGATRYSNPYLKFKIGYSTSSESEENDTNWASATATKIIIEEKPQEWELGVKKARRIMFDVFPSTIYTGGEDVIWATLESTGLYYTEMIPATTVGNGQNIADLEWFCMGERGDQYRLQGWPNVIKTAYLADESKTYSVLEFHYAFTDTGVNSYRTEKELTIAVPDGAAGHTYDVINGIIGEVNTAAGTSISTLS